MPSLRGAILRCMLSMRKTAIAWDVPIETLRAMQKWSDRLITLPRDIEFKPALTADVAAEWIIPARSASPAVIFYVHGGGWTLRCIRSTNAVLKTYGGPGDATE